MLAVVQGLTEFLPISSSGHFVIVQHILGISDPNLFLNITLHMGTLVAVLLFLRRDFTQIISGVIGAWKEKAAVNHPAYKIVIFAIIATIPAVIVALMFEDYLDNMFSSFKGVGILLLINAVILSTSLFARHSEKGMQRFSLRDAVLIGMAQACAIFPGISRSGMTITCALLCGLHPALAFKFSFLLFIPAIGGALLLHILELGGLNGYEMMYYSIGGIIAGIVGYGALSLLIRIVTKNRFYLFSFYCCIVGLCILLF